MSEYPHVYMVASENGALPGGKAGGVGDVVRELPRALAARGVDLTVLCPSYGKLHHVDGMTFTTRMVVPFGATSLSVECWQHVDDHGVTHLVFDHDGFNGDGKGSIYHDDGPLRPFATDATRFALLCAAAATWLPANAADDAILHLHDWHAAPLAVLRAYEPALSALQQWRTVFTLHNLGIQGIRPLADDTSSLSAWFPALTVCERVVADPRYGNCFNPMLAGIRLADAVNTVSPTNAREILAPDDPARGYRGGEGLHDALLAADAEGRLHGILNGCDYDIDASRLDWPAVRETVLHTLRYWRQSDRVNGALHDLARANFEAHGAEKPSMLLTSVGRLTDQKVAIAMQQREDGRTALEHALDALDPDGMLTLVGTGDPDIERLLVEASRRDRRLVFLRGFSETLADALYRGGDLFLMPSSYEPCGISQMLAMRSSQPCLVHAVGGLNDTVADGLTGFTFAGDGIAAQTDAFVARTHEAIAMFREAPESYADIAEAAGHARFPWSDAARDYMEKLYGFAH
ncbi:MAG: glycogen/starch synthase [Pseudomonadota bacterium]